MRPSAWVCVCVLCAAAYLVSTVRKRESVSGVAVPS